MQCRFCGSLINDMCTRCPYCGQDLNNNFHTALDFPKYYGERKIIVGFAFYLRVFLSLIFANIFGAIFYYLYRTMYNRSIYAYRGSQFDYAYKEFVKSIVFRFLYVLSYPLNIGLYIGWTILHILKLLF